MNNESVYNIEENEVDKLRAINTETKLSFSIEHFLWNLCDICCRFNIDWSKERWNEYEST